MSSVPNLFVRTALGLGLWAGLVVPAGAQELFPQAFVVEHRLVQTTADGDRFESPPVTDYYGGSWIVSVRPDGSRLVVDLARRELTEIRPDAGTYSVLSFGRMAELVERSSRAQRRTRPERPAGDAVVEKSTAAAPEPPELVVEELAPTSAAALKTTSARGRGADQLQLQHLRVVEKGAATDEGALEVWLDPSLTLTPAALDALGSFEEILTPGAARASGTKGASAPRVAQRIAAARRHARGAMPVGTVRHVVAGSARVRVEDEPLRIEILDALPRDLVTVPEGLRRVPHPLEAAVAFLEAEAERERMLSGEGGDGAEGVNR